MRTIGMAVVLLLWSGVGPTAADPAEDLTPERRQELEKKAATLTEEARGYYRAGNYAKAIEVMREALYPKAQYPDGHPALANSVISLGAPHMSTGEHGKAEPLFREALE